MTRKAHPYALPNHYREKTSIAMAVIAVGCAWGFHWAMTALSLNVPWWVDAPSVVGFYGLIHAMFDRWVWKWKTIRRAFFSGVPELSGNWTGSVRSSFDSLVTEFPVTATIVQSWSRLGLFFEGDRSESDSRTAALDVGDDGVWDLLYTYRNEPSVEAPDDMTPHHGTAMLRLASNDLAGDYYSGRGRRNYGSIRLTRTLRP